MAAKTGFRRRYIETAHRFRLFAGHCRFARIVDGQPATVEQDAPVREARGQMGVAKDRNEGGAVARAAAWFPLGFQATGPQQCRMIARPSQ